MGERNKELALLRSLGMNKRSVQTLIITEQALLIYSICLAQDHHKRKHQLLSFRAWNRSVQSITSIGSLSVSLLLYTLLMAMDIHIHPQPYFSRSFHRYFSCGEQVVQPIELFGKQL